MTDIKTPLARLSFAQDLFKMKTNDKGKKSWGCTLLFPKSTDLSAMEQLALDAAIEKWGDKAAQWIKDGVIKSPFLDGDGPQAVSKKTGERHEGYAGHRFIRLSSGEAYRPKLVNRKRLPVTSQDECYSGCYVYAIVNAYDWEHPTNGKGVSFGISAVQVVKDGEHLGGGGGVDPDEAFDVIDDEGEAPAETKSGKGAEGLFA